MVVFEDGLARKSEYRRFAIRGFGTRPGGDPGQNDVAAIHEVVSRRFRRYLEEQERSGALGLGADDVGTLTVNNADGPDGDSAGEYGTVARQAEPDHEPTGSGGDEDDDAGATRQIDSTARRRSDARAAGGLPAGIDPDTGRPRKFAYPPNLVVVDGGAPQVAAAARALAELGIDDVALCGLAKRLEEVWLPGEIDPVILPRSSEGLYLLQRVRDEAHRFAITYHRKRRSKTMTTSALDGIPGLGETRRKALLRRFGSLKRLRAASVEEIADVPGIGIRTAEAIAAALASAAVSTPAVNTATGEVIE
jgi:excinuclease ABC subunit C